MVEHLFVYGTLRRDLGHAMHRVLAQHSRYAGTARYAGRMYDVGAYPAVVPDPESAPAVQGELYRLQRPAVLLPLLDRYEGCTEGDDPAAEYRREVQPVVRHDGTTVQAWVYLYNQPVRTLRPIGSGDYLAR